MTNTNLYVVGGNVQARRGAVYLDRQADVDLLKLCRESTFAYVLTARQMGKSSLMNNTATELAKQNISSVKIDLTQIGRESKEAWYSGILFEIEQQLKLRVNVTQWWRQQDDKGIGDTRRWLLFFEEVLLAKRENPVVIFLDEIEVTRKLGFTDEFFAAIRSMYNLRGSKPIFHKLTFVLIGLARPNDLIQDEQLTPFNIGQQVVLTDFTFDEALPLSEGFGLDDANARRVLKLVLNWTGGHPYLTQRLCQELAAKPGTDWSSEAIDSVVAKIFQGEESFQDTNLRWVQKMLVTEDYDRADVLATYRRILRGKTVPDETQSHVKAHLRLSGVVHSSDNLLSVRNSIYRNVFNEKWVKEHFPVNWPKRFTRIAAGLVLTLMALSVPTSVWAVISRRQAVKAEREAVAAQREAIAERDEAKRQRQIADTFYAEATRERDRARDLAEKERMANIELKELADVQVQLSSRAQLAAKEAEEARDAARVARDTSDSHALGVSADAFLKFGGSLQSAVQLARASLQKSINQGADVPIDASAYEVLTAGLPLLPSSRLIIEPADKEKYLLTLLTRQGKYAIATYGSNSVRVIETKSGKETANLTGLPAGVTMYPDPTERYMAISSGKLVRTVELSNGQEIASPVESSIDATYIAVSQSGKYLAVSNGNTTLEIWHLKSNKKVRSIDLEFNNGSPVNKTTWLEFTLDEQRLAGYGSDGTVRLWDVITGQLWATLEHLGATGMVISPKGTYIATSGSDDVRLWDPKSGKNITSLKHVNALPFFSENEDLLATFSSEDNRALIWKIPDGKIVSTIDIGPFRYTCAFSPSGKYIAVVFSPGTFARVWNVNTRREEVRLEIEDTIKDLTFTANDAQLVTVSYKPGAGPVETTRAWALPGRWGDIQYEVGVSSRLTISPNQKYVAENLIGKVDISEVETGREIARLEQEGEIRRVVFSHDSNYVAIDSGSTLSVWNLASKRKVASLQSGPGYQLSIIFNTDGRHLVTVSHEATRVWDIQTGKKLNEIENGLHYISPAGNYLAQVRSDTFIRLLDLTNQRDIAQFRSPDTIYQLVFSADGTRFAVTTGTTARVYQSSTGKEVMTVDKQSTPWSTSLSPDGKLVGTVEKDGLRFWDVETGRLLQTINDSAFSNIRGFAFDEVVFSSDWKYVVVTANGMMRIWEVATGRQMANQSFDGEFIAFSSDDKYLIVAVSSRSPSFEGALQFRLWQPEDLINETCARVNLRISNDRFRSIIGNSDIPAMCPVKLESTQMR